MHFNITSYCYQFCNPFSQMFYSTAIFNKVKMWAVAWINNKGINKYSWTITMYGSWNFIHWPWRHDMSINTWCAVECASVTQLLILSLHNDDHMNLQIERLHTCNTVMQHSMSCDLMHNTLLILGYEFTHLGKAWLPIQARNWLLIINQHDYIWYTLGMGTRLVIHTHAV